MDQFTSLKAGTAQIIPEEDFKKKLANGKKLRIQLGADPTAPDLDLGHAVASLIYANFRILVTRLFSLLAILPHALVIPRRSKTRPPLTDEQIAFNTKTYFTQVSKILRP